MLTSKSLKQHPAAQVSAPSASAEQPLSPAEALRLAVAVTGLLLLFYAGAALALVFIGAVFAFILVLLVGAARFGLSGFMKSPLKAQMDLFTRVLQSLNLRRGAEFRLALGRQDAPELFDLASAAAQRVGMASPQEIFLEMSDNAWVRLRGYRTGQGHCALGLGFDLLSMLTSEELAAVLAHEMAHARLMQRGHFGWARNGLGRLAQLVDALQPWAKRVRGKRFFTAEALAWGTCRLAKQVSRLLAALSRQEEFAADRLAAETVGPAVFARALTVSHLIGIKGKDLDWRSRLIQLQREESFVDWLHARLAIRDQDEWETLKQYALKQPHGGEYGSHPALASRLAAIAEAFPGTEMQNNGPADRQQCAAVFLLAAPETTAAALAAEMECIAAAEERKQSERMRGWVRGARRQRLAHLRARTVGEGLAMVCFGLGAAAALGGAVMLGIALLDSHPGSELGPAAQGLGSAAALVLLGLFFMRRFGYREQALLPIPPLEEWKAALGLGQTAKPVRKNAQTEALAAESLEAEVGSRAPQGWRRSQTRARLFGQAAYEALGQGDVVRAHAAARLCLQARPSSPEGLIASGITAAYFGDRSTANQLLGKAADTFSVGPSLSAALAWARLMEKDWPNAEAFLHDALGHRPQTATLWSLLGVCQWQQGRTREAVQSMRMAISREPEAAEHRVLLLRLLIASGHLRDAAEVLAWLEAAHICAAPVREASVRLALFAGQAGRAQERADQWEQQEPSASTRLCLSHAFSDAGNKDAARLYLQKIRQSEFCPEALVDFARLAHGSGDNKQAREFLRESLDLTRPQNNDMQTPLDMLSTVLRGLIALQPQAEQCQPGIAEIDLPKTIRIAALDPLPTQVTLTVYAPTQEAADVLVHEFYAALLAGFLPPPGRVRWRSPEGTDSAPKAMQPGIYGCRLS